MKKSKLVKWEIKLKNWKKWKKLMTFVKLEKKNQKINKWKNEKIENGKNKKIK